jgi:alpha-beta hydrolase superfamily lysophospholipase
VHFVRLLLAALLSIAAAQPAPTGTVRPVVYSGGYGPPGAFTVTIIDLVEGQGSASGKIRQPDDRTDEPPMRNVVLSDGGLAFDAADLHFDLRRTEHGFAGTVRDGAGARRDAAFVRRPGAVDPGILETYEGSYSLGGSRILTLSRNNAGSGFWYLDLPSGRTGFLFNLSEREFTAGPCLYCAGPEYLRLGFAPSSGGAARSVTVTVGGRTIEARRAEGYREVEVNFTGRDGTRLAGSLFVPDRAGRLPAVVMAHGSGAQTRNGYYGHIRFLAEAFARRGIAVLAFDKRGTGRSQGDWERAGFATLADDVAAAVAYLRTRPDVRPDRIGLTGLSQAGWIMPMAATRAGGIRFIQHFSAASPMGVREQERRRLILQMEAERFPQAEIDAAARIRDMMDHYAATGENWEALERAAAPVANGRWMRQFIGGLPAPDAPDWPWLREAFGYDTRPDFARFAGSWHVLYGDRDIIAPIREGRAMLEAAIRGGPSRDVTIEVIERATHNFLEAETGSDREFSGLTRFVPGYHAKVVGWAARRLR